MKNFRARISKRADAIVNPLKFAPSPIFDMNNVRDAVSQIKTGINAPIVGVSVSTLGGPERVTIMLAIGLDPKEKWINGIFENSRYMRFRLERNGELEQFTRTVGGKFRKCYVKSIQEAIDKINSHIKLQEMQSETQSEKQISSKINFRKKIEARVKIAGIPNEGQREFLDKRVSIGGHDYDVSVVVDYSSEWEPRSGDGFNEPREGGYFSVGVDIAAIKAYNSESEEVTNEELLNVIKSQFLRLYESFMEDEISDSLEEDARDSDGPDPDWDGDY